MKGLFWSSFQKKLVSFDEWMTDAETNIGDLEMDNGKKKMMGGGRSSKDSGLRTHRILARNKSTPMPRQEGIKQATKQRLAKADGGKMKYMKGGMSKKTRADTPTGGRTRSVGIGGDTSRIAMQFKKNHPGVVKSLGYSEGGKATNGNKSARREYSKGGMASAMKSSKPC